MSAALLATLLALASLLAGPVAQVREAGEAPPAWQLAWDEGHVEESLEQLRAACRSEPGLAPLLAQRLMGLGRYTAALDVARPLGAAGRDVSATCLYLLARYDAALELLDAENPQQTLLRVDALEVQGRPEQAREALLVAARVLGEQHPEVLAVRGRLLAADGHDAEAVEAFRAALAADPIQMAALFGLGRALLRLGQADEARAVLAEHRRLGPLVDQREAARRAVELSPRHAPNLALLGDAERDLGRLQLAHAAYLRASELARGSERVPVLLRFARLLSEDLVDLDGALALLDAEAAHSDDPRLPVRAGDLLAKAQRRDEAAARYRQALALRPGDPQIEARLAQWDGDGSPP